MSKCLVCRGSKHHIIEIRHPLYPKTTTRIYLGRCDRCDANGNVIVTQDRKQASSGEVVTFQLTSSSY